MRRRALTILICLICSALAISGCAPNNKPAEPQAATVPPKNEPEATHVVKQLVQALTTGDLPQAGFSAAEHEEWKTLTKGMAPVTPQISAQPVVYGPKPGSATVTLNYTWPLDTVTWQYATRVGLRLESQTWKPIWHVSVVHPKLTDQTRLRLTRKLPRREAIQDSAGLALVEQLPQVQVGLDKAAISPQEWEKSATQLAQRLGIDAASYVKQVKAGGEKQFVVAKVLPMEQVPEDIDNIPGSHQAEAQRMVPFSPTFAVGILGRGGPATKEQIDKGKGLVWDGDLVGYSGLQARYEKQLRGVPELTVEAIPRTKNTNQTTDAQPTELFRHKAEPGKPVKTSIDRGLQTKAEQLLAKQPGIASIVVISHADGAVRVAANSPKAGEYPYATFGKFAPGSTFKVVSALAMLRSGMSPSSKVSCPASWNIYDKKITNYSGYPGSAIGSITLTQALAQSCNTAFAQRSRTVSPQQLHDAAASLGMGTDYDAGFSSNFGTAKPGNNPVQRATSMFGQGDVTASPLAMAAVAASVAKGSTVIPWLVEGHQARPAGPPLTSQEAASLQQMMRAVVTQGTASVLRGVMDGAKTGTAEFGEAGKYKTHAWMIAWNATYAVAVFVKEGKSGSTDAAPLIKQLFS